MDAGCGVTPFLASTLYTWTVYKTKIIDVNNLSDSD